MKTLNINQISTILKVSDKTILRWIKEGELGGNLQGNRYTVKLSDLKELIDLRKGSSCLAALVEEVNTNLSQKLGQQLVEDELTVEFFLSDEDLESLKLPVLQRTLNTSDNNLTKDFYEPCLKWATRYDRAVGYFTSSWIKVNSVGIASFAVNNGKARWIVSPILDDKDADAFRKTADKIEMEKIFSYALRNNLDRIKSMIEKDVLNVLSWMIYDEILEFKFAIGANHLENGDFHDKFGIFYDKMGNKASFNGSVNDSFKGTVNYESIKTFSSWEGLKPFVEDDERRFQRLWDNADDNIIVYSLPEAVKEEIFQLRHAKRPYEMKIKNKWRHQNEAKDVFLRRGNGILEMATGTGKTRTAIAIANALLRNDEISSIIITVNGTDLLDQWYKELTKETNIDVFRYYEDHKELPSFILNPEESAILVSRNADFLDEVLSKTREKVLKNSLIICDEVHGLGSPSLVNRLKGKIKPIKYRLGLSATPEREYDEDGNQFIIDEIGDVVFRFGIIEAIKREILCEFDYTPLSFELSKEDRAKIQKLIATFNAMKDSRIPNNAEDLYRDIARVKKVSLNKIPIFREFIARNTNILHRSIIFVETKDFGLEIQNVIINYIRDFHTYYGEDDRKNLTRFSRGEVNCLITSKRISEGIDIKSVNNIILFTADRAKLMTMQRIGRALRIDPDNQNKKAHIVDFISRNYSNKDEQNVVKESNTDENRKIWLQELSRIRREE